MKGITRITGRLMLVFLTLIASSMMFLSSPAIAAGCNQTLSTGAATTDQTFWEQPLAFYGWSGGTITNDMYFNGCGRATAIKVNMDDWNKLISEGKLDGLRYIYKNSNSIIVRKVQGTQPTTIPQDKFFNSTTVAYQGNK